MNYERKTMKKFVQHLNLTNGVTTTIPAEELAPDCILASGPGFASGSYVEMSKLRTGCKPVHAAVPPEAQRALLYYCESVASVDPLSVSEHQFYLRCNQNPVGQLAILCHIGRIFRQFCKTKVISPSRRLELLLLLQRCSVAEKDTILQIHKPEFLSKRVCGAVIQEYYGSDPWEFFSAKFKVSTMPFPPIKH